MIKDGAIFHMGIKKAHLPRRAIFVNLKSNTMKNTVQMYGFSGNLQIYKSNQRVL